MGAVFDTDAARRLSCRGFQLHRAMSDHPLLHLSNPLSVTEMAAKRKEIEARGLGAWPVPGKRDLALIEQVGGARREACDEAARRGLTGDERWPRIALPWPDLQTAAWPELSDDIVYYLLVGDYESPDLGILGRAVRRGDSVAVAGGGIGLCAAWMARLAGTPVQVIEAREDLLVRIRATLAMNQAEGEAHHGALTAQGGGEVAIGVGDSLWFSSMALAGQPGTRRVLAPGRGLDDVCQAWHPDVLLVDIEGGEAALDFGSVSARPREVVMEIHTPTLGSVETCRIAQGLFDAGYRLADLVGQTWWFSRRAGGA